MSASSVTPSEGRDHVAKTFDFSVDKFPLSGPDGMKTNGVYGLFRSDNGQHVGRPCSKKYLAHQTEDVLALFDAGSEAFDGQVDVKCHFRDGHYVSIAPTLEYRQSIYGDKDNVFPRIIVNAGYNGQSFKAVMGYYRDLCDNMAMMTRVEGTSVAIRHTSGLRYKMDSLISSFETLKESWGDLHSLIARLEGQTASAVDFLNAVYGQPDENSKKAITTHRNRTEEIWYRLDSERYRSGRPQAINHEYSLWELYNAVQGHHQHKRTAAQRSGAAETPSYFEDVLRAANAPAVKKAEELALELVA